MAGGGLLQGRSTADPSGDPNSCPANHPVSSKALIAPGCRRDGTHAWERRPPGQLLCKCGPARRRGRLGAPVSDRHRPPPAGEHVLAHAGVARRRPASPSGPGAVRRCGRPGRVPPWSSAFPVGSTNSEYVPKLSCYFGMTSKIDTYPRTWRTLSPVRLARPRIPSLATPATQGIADGDKGGTERIGPTHSRR